MMSILNDLALFSKYDCGASFLSSRSAQLTSFSLTSFRSTLLLTPFVFVLDINSHPSHLIFKAAQMATIQPNVPPQYIVRLFPESTTPSLLWCYWHFKTRRLTKWTILVSKSCWTRLKTLCIHTMSSDDRARPLPTSTTTKHCIPTSSMARTKAAAGSRPLAKRADRDEPLEAFFHCYKLRYTSHTNLLWFLRGLVVAQYEDSYLTGLTHVPNRLRLAAFRE